MRTFSRIVIIAFFVAVGALYGMQGWGTLQGAALGLFIGIVATVLESVLRRISFGHVLGGLIGLVIGILFAILLLLPLRPVMAGESWSLSSFIVAALLGYGGLFAGLHRGKSLSVPTILRLFKGQELEQDLKVLDTSVIIDGRIADVIEVGFLEGTFIVPHFILQELQYIADSPDPMRRTKGRRGLDMLHRIQKMANVNVRIVEEDFPRVREVDAKLIALARLFNAKIVTNDFNMNKVAQLQGLTVLNINELANVLKPVVLPGESLSLFVVKEGKEHNQGVAYLEDGTMVVIENGRRFMGKNIEATVTSMLQTTAGRMIFARPKEED